MSASRSKSAQLRQPNACALVGVVLWLVSWFVPVFSGQSLLNGLGQFASDVGAKTEAPLHAIGGPQWLPGWTACRFAWEVLVDPPEDSREPRWQLALCGASCLTNAVMLVAVAFLLAKYRSPGIGVALLASAGVASSWLWAGDGSAREWLQAGYYFWLASFAIAGIGFVLAARE